MDRYIEQMLQDPVVVDAKENSLFKGYHIQQLRVASNDGRYPIVGSNSFPAPASWQATQNLTSSK